MISLIYPRIIQDISSSIPRDGKIKLRSLFGKPVNADLVTVFTKPHNCCKVSIPVVMAMTPVASTNLILTDLLYEHYCQVNRIETIVLLYQTLMYKMT